MPMQSEAQVIRELLVQPQVVQTLYQHMLVAILTWEKLTFEDRQRLRDLVAEKERVK